MSSGAKAASAPDYLVKAAQMWISFDKNKRAGVRFGLFPAEDMRAAEAAGFTDSHALVCALMDVAKANK